jgi:HSP20 family protein
MRKEGPGNGAGTVSQKRPKDEHHPAKGPEDGYYVLRAEIAGIDPEKDLEVGVGAGYLAIRAARSGHVEGKHRSEFRYGSFSRTLELPPGADADDVTAEYADGILTIKVAVKGEHQEAVKRIPVTAGKK